MRWKAAAARQPVDYLATSRSLIFGLLAVNRQHGQNSKIGVMYGLATTRDLLNLPQRVVELREDYSAWGDLR